MSLYLLDLLGVAVFAASGALAAGRKRVDLLGVLVIAAVTAVGGGTLRDLLLARQVFWMADPTYLSVILGAVIVTLVYERFRRPPVNALVIADAFGLALFTIGGAQIAERAGVSNLIVVIMAAMTGVVGGVFRDVLLAEIPMILRRGDIYATASIAGATTYLLMKPLGVGSEVAAVVGVTVVMVLRLAAILYGLKLPTIVPRWE